MAAADQDTLRKLPSVDEVLRDLAGLRCPHPLLVSLVRRQIDAAREKLRATGAAGDIRQAVAEAVAALRAPSLKRVINATGVVLHTNLGRAPLPGFSPIYGYSNLEYGLDTGRRGRRDTHVSSLLEHLTGKPGIAVNNNAAATYLVLNELAPGGEVIVSRGELIEIGDGFRIPDIMARSGAVLREVGTTNRTGIADYRNAISERTRLIMRVHPSNFHISGFTGKPELAELAALAREYRIPLYEDLGSGCVADLRPFGITEPLVAASLEAGVNVVSFSGDKLLGGPQAGLICGDKDRIERIRRNPMFRAMRLDKLITQALEVTLRHLLFEEWEAIPALRMIRTSAAELQGRAQRLAQRIPGAEVMEGASVVGGGSTPDQKLPSWVVAIPGSAVRIEAALRGGDPPVIARIENDRLLLDLRCVPEWEEEDLLAAIKRAT
ncbi:MAG: L-seryl-tRNA(Sec) selenium transferase [Bryobacteraceae bacterium]|nr:L-seryl-tRNA(Sec) selenium transferase [Bryobacteraceae bacterium]